MSDVVVALVVMHVYESSATGRFPRALLYEEVFYTLHGVFASQCSLCCMPEEQQERFHQASSYEHVCPLRDVFAIARSAEWKMNNSKCSLKHHFMNTSKFSGTHGDRGIFIFPVQLTTSRTGNLTRLIDTLLYVTAIHTYIP